MTAILILLLRVSPQRVALFSLEETVIAKERSD
jgi:hypothetical protein